MVYHISRYYKFAYNDLVLRTVYTYMNYCISVFNLQELLW